MSATESAIDKAAHSYREAGVLSDQGVYFFKFEMGFKPEGDA